MNTLLRYNNMWNTFETLTGELFDDVQYASKARGYYKETDSGYEYELELPGYKKKDITMTAIEGLIKINAVRDNKSKSFSVEVPEDTELSSISGQLLDGLLIIKIDKQEKAKPITVKIK